MCQQLPVCALLPSFFIILQTHFKQLPSSADGAVAHCSGHCACVRAGGLVVFMVSKDITAHYCGHLHLQRSRERSYARHYCSCQHLQHAKRHVSHD